MTVLALVSAKGSPGVTTLGLRLADALARLEKEERGDAARWVVFVEGDTDGGDVAARCGIRATPGIATLALVARRALEPATVLEHCQPLGRALILTGVAGARQGALVAPLVPRIVDSLTGLGALVVLDAGRLAANPGDDAALAGAAILAVVTRTGTDALVHARSAVHSAKSAGLEPAIVLVGRSRSSVREIESALGAPVLGSVADARVEAAHPLAPAADRNGDLQRSVEALALTISQRLEQCLVAQ